MYPQYMFEQKYENTQTISTGKCHFCSSEKSLYIAWACLRNEHANSCLEYEPISIIVSDFSEYFC